MQSGLAPGGLDVPLLLRAIPLGSIFNASYLFGLWLCHAASSHIEQLCRIIVVGSYPNSWPQPVISFTSQAVIILGSRHEADASTNFCTFLLVLSCLLRKKYVKESCGEHSFPRFVFHKLMGRCRSRASWRVENQIQAPHWQFTVNRIKVVAQLARLLAEQPARGSVAKAQSVPSEMGQPTFMRD